MRFFLTSLLFFISAHAVAVDTDGYTCTKVYEKCTDSARRDVNGEMLLLSEIDGGPAHDCWTTEKVYRCVEDDWTTSCTAETQDGATVTSVNATNYAPVWSSDKTVKYKSHYKGSPIDQKESTLVDTSVNEKSYNVYIQQYSNPYILSCPSSSTLDGYANPRTISGFSSYATSRDCSSDPDWSVSNSNQSISNSFAGYSWSFDTGNPLQQSSHWACVSDVSSSCDSTDVADCPVLGYIGVGEENTALPSVAPCGQYESCMEYRECELNVTTTCDHPDAVNCQAPFAANPILHPEITDAEIGIERQYTCYDTGDVSEICSAEVSDPGYSGCDWSYYTCNVAEDPSIDPATNIHNGRSYGQCPDFTDHYVCPSDIVVVCDSPLNNCGAPTVENEVFNGDGDIVYWDDVYTCYNGDIDDSCDNPDGHDFYDCIKVGATCVRYDADNHGDPSVTGTVEYGNCVEWVDDYICPSDSEYNCDRDPEYEDCRPSERRVGSETTSGSYDGAGEILFTEETTGYIDDYVCWNGDVDEVCAIDESSDRTGCDWTGYTCYEHDPDKAQPNIFDGRDYEDCVSWTDNWVCNSAIEVTCDGEYDECGPESLLDGLPDDVHACFLTWQDNEALYEECVYDGGATTDCRSTYPEVVCSDPESDSRVYNPDDVITDWANQRICYTGDNVESCEEQYSPDDIHECTHTGFDCLVDDPVNNTDPDPTYGTCKVWIDRYVCEGEEYNECDSDFEMCHSQVVTEQEYNEDGVEIFSREVEFCYTEQYNDSLCALENDKCYVYDDAVGCEQQILARDEDYATCIDEGNPVSYCDTTYPEPTCKTEVACPTGQRPGTDCQLDWNAHDAAMDACLTDGTNKTVGECESLAPLPACDPVSTDYLDCDWSGFTCKTYDPLLSDAQADENNYDGRNYGKCIEWEDRYTCPQNQWEDCTGDVDTDNECGPLGYVEIYHEQDGQATDYTTILECVSDPNMPECVVDPSCALYDVECSESDGGLCTEQTQIYTCQVNRDDCVEYDLTCQNPIDYGLTLETENPNDLGAFIATASTAKMVADNTSIVGGDIQIFAGVHKRCRKLDYANVQAMIAAAMVIIYWTGDYSLIDLVLYWSALLAIDYDCCMIDNTMAPDAHGTGIAGACDPSDDNSDCSGYDGGMLEMLRCDEEEVELSKSRGAKTTIGHFGRYCTEDVLGYCLERGYSYCEFDNMFSRIVQEQGRDQIAQALTSGSSGAVEYDFAFNYTTNITGGAWNVVNGSGGVNGNRIAVWSWDEDCINYNAMVNLPEDVDDYLPPVCPFSDEVHIAVCMNGTSCTTLPDSPYTQYNTSGGSNIPTDYRLKIADPNNFQNFALSPSVFVAGQCGTTVLTHTNQVVTWTDTAINTNENVTLTVPQNLYSGGDLVATFHKVHVNWGDGQAEDMVLSGGSFTSTHAYLFESSFAGNNIGVVLTTVEGEVFSTTLNMLVRNDMSSNPNDNSQAGRITLSAAGTVVSPEQCNYKFSAYPAGSGASTSIGYDLNWINGVYIDPAAPDQVGQWSEFVYDVGPHEFIPYELKDVNTSLSTVKIKIDGIEYDLPKNTGGSEITIGPLRFNGSCNDEYKSCTYRAFRDMTLTMMDWGEIDNPNCRGFYPEEIEALDFGRMDLSEWIATIMPKTELTSDEKDDLVAEAETSAINAKSRWETDEADSDGEVKVVFFKELVGHPRDTFKFRVAEVVNVTQDYSFEITKVRMTWGDGTPFEEQAGGNYTFTHEYNRESGKNGFVVDFALTGNLDGTEVLYETSVRILVGYAPNKDEMMNKLGGGVINVKEFFRFHGTIDSY